uniref:Protein krueppel n=1 Tax=Timema poppense TaxID=170557 RepID=A0A7R9HAL3_TIMPO|nr:unnamed protein product [Timema poppensis]
MSSESDTDIINYGGSPLTEPMDLVCLKREIDLNHDQELDVDPRSKLIVQLEESLPYNMVTVTKATLKNYFNTKKNIGKAKPLKIRKEGVIQEIGNAMFIAPEGFTREISVSETGLSDGSDSRSSSRTKDWLLARQIKTWVCRICNKQFTMRGDLRAHERIHTGEKPYRCTHCDKRFNRSNNLKTHLRTHTGERPFSCLECGRAFSQREHLRTHMRTHTGEKPFSCELCAVQFTRSCDLTRHVRTHTGDKPYACEVCEKRFTKNNNLVAHRRTHEVAHGEKAEGRLNVLMHVETHLGEEETVTTSPS